MHLAVANGSLYTMDPLSASDFTLRTTPTATTLIAKRPSFAKFRRTVVINGRYSPGVIYRDDLDIFSRLGIQKPSAAVSVATSGTGVTGNVIVYFAWAEYQSGTLVHQGNLSPASATLVCTNQGVAVTSIPATAPDARTTHARIFMSIDGDIPKFVDKVTIGTTTFTWNGTPARSTEVFPVNADGTINSDARGVPPFCLWAVAYHDRIWYGGDPSFPQRVWYSLIDEPESVGPLAFFDTLDREAVTGMAVFEDTLVVFCHDCTYDLQGYSAGGSNPDFNMRKVDPEVGCISHFGIVKINRRLWFPSRQGVCVYDGATHFKMRDLARYWRDAYADAALTYEDSIAIHDHISNVYKLLIPGDTAFYYVAAYDGAETGDDQPAWSFDRRNRQDYTMGKLWFGDRQGACCTGATDGFIRQDNIASDGTDDADTLGKQLTIRTKHYQSGDPGGFRAHGLTFREILLHLKSDNQGFTVSAFGGDDPARSASGPTWGPHTIAAMTLAGAVPETVKPLRPTGLSGGGTTVELVVPNPVGFEYRGISLSPIPGPRFRGVTT